MLRCFFVHWRKSCAVGLDGKGWTEFKSYPAPMMVCGLGHCLMLKLSWTPKSDGVAAPLGQRPLCVLSVVYRLWAFAHLGEWFASWVPHTLSALLVVGAILLTLDTLQLLRLKSPSLGLLTLMFVSLLPMLLIHLIPLIEVFLTAYFVAWAHVRLRFKLSGCLGEPWTRDRNISCLVHVISIVTYLGVTIRMLEMAFSHADSLKSVTQDSEQLLRTARFTTRFIRLVGQQPAPSKCVLLCTSRVTMGDMRNWIISHKVKNGLLSWMYVTWEVMSTLPNVTVFPHLGGPSCYIVK